MSGIDGGRTWPDDAAGGADDDEAVDSGEELAEDEQGEDPRSQVPPQEST